MTYAFYKRILGQTPSFALSGRIKRRTPRTLPSQGYAYAGTFLREDIFTSGANNLTRERLQII